MIACELKLFVLLLAICSLWGYTRLNRFQPAVKVPHRPIVKARRPQFHQKKPPVLVDDDVTRISHHERLQKVIARSGLASRRTAEEMIQDGRISVNGKLVSELGIRVNAKVDNILVDGKKVIVPDVKSTFWVAVNKPKSILTTMKDEKDRETVQSLVPKAGELRLVPVGGLDRDFTGLMVMTNEVGWIHYLTHPAFPHNNRYEVVVEGVPSEESLDILREGVLLSGDRVPCIPCTVNVVEIDTKAKLSILNMLVDERSSMQLERMLEHIGCVLVSMKRLEYCGLRLKGLRKGAWRELTPAEISSIKLNCNPASGLAKGYATSSAAAAAAVNPTSSVRKALGGGSAGAPSPSRSAGSFLGMVNANRALRQIDSKSDPATTTSIRAQSSTRTENSRRVSTNEAPSGRKDSSVNKFFRERAPREAEPGEDAAETPSSERMYSRGKTGDSGYSQQPPKKVQYERSFRTPSRDAGAGAAGRSAHQNRAETVGNGGGPLRGTTRPDQQLGVKRASVGSYGERKTGQDRSQVGTSSTHPLSRSERGVSPYKRVRGAPFSQVGHRSRLRRDEDDSQVPVKNSPKRAVSKPARSNKNSRFNQKRF